MDATRYNKFNAEGRTLALAATWTKAVLGPIPIPIFYLLFFISLTILEYFSFHLSPDISTQGATVINFASGNGISLASVDDNYAVSYNTISYWPAGLVLFLTPFYLFTKSTVAAAILLKMAAYLFLLFFLSAYFRHFQLEQINRKLILLFFATAVAPFIHLYPSDSLAMVLCLWGFYFNMKYLNEKKVAYVLAALTLLGLSYFVKYSFIPFLFYPVISFLIMENTQSFRKIGQLLILTGFTLVAAISVYTLNFLLIGKSTVPAAWDALNGNPHWKQLSRFDGFLFTFGNYEWALENFIKNHFGVNFQFNWISVLVTVYFHLLFLIVCYKWKRFQNKKWLSSINISLTAGSLIILFLAFLSLNNPGQTWSTPYWTFVEETRYFAPVIVIGLLNVLVITLDLRKISLSLLLIVLMVGLNLLAYKFIIQNGSWGQNYQTYVEVKEKMNEVLSSTTSDETSVVFVDNDVKNSASYYYLLSQGLVLLPKSKQEAFIARNTRHTYYLLKSQGGRESLIHLTKPIQSNSDKIIN